MNKNWKTVLQYLFPLLGVFLVVLFYTLARSGIQHTIVIMTMVLVVLFSALFAGMGPGLTAAVAAALSYNFFFIPPVRTFAIASPEDAAAFVVFLVSAMIVGALSASASRQRREAENRKKEIEKLFELAKELIEIPRHPSNAVQIADHIVKIFGLEYCGIHVPSGKGKWKHVSLSSGFPRNLRLPGPADFRDLTLDSIIDEQDKQVRYRMMRTPDGLVGMIAFRAGEIPDHTISTIASLVTLAFQR